MRERIATRGAEIRRRRIEMGLDQPQLALKAGFLSSNTIGMIERGDRGGSPSTIKAIADALGCSVADLIEAPTEVAS